jgi:hypothetical protein
VELEEDEEVGEEFEKKVEEAIIEVKNWIRCILIYIVEALIRDPHRARTLGECQG